MYLVFGILSAVSWLAFSNSSRVLTLGSSLETLHGIAALCLLPNLYEMVKIIGPSSLPKFKVLCSWNNLIYNIYKSWSDFVPPTWYQVNRGAPTGVRVAIRIRPLVAREAMESDGNWVGLPSGVCLGKLHPPNKKVLLFVDMVGS